MRDFTEYVGKVDEETNLRLLSVYAQATSILSQHGIQDTYVIGSVAVSAYTGSFIKTFGDIEIITTQENLRIIEEILPKQGFKTLAILEDRNAFDKDGVWIGYIDRAAKFIKMGVDPEGAYQNSHTIKLHGIDIKCLNPNYLRDLYTFALQEKPESKTEQYTKTLEIMNYVVDNQEKSNS